MRRHAADLQFEAAEAAHQEDPAKRRCSNRQQDADIESIVLKTDAGTPLRVRLQARDISLALQHHEDSSVLNVLPATLVELTELPGGQVQVRLDASGAPLLARVSHRSVERLGLRPGMPLWAQVKAVALLV